VLEQSDGLGEGFVMDFVEGEALGGRIVKSEALALIRPLLAGQCGAILAGVHRIDPAAFPNLDRLSPADLVDQWRAAYVRANWPRPVFELALRWLTDHCPEPPVSPCVVHGDFRNGNLMIGAEGVRAVLDWELAHVGDRHEDLAWICVNSWRFGRIDLPVGGFGDRADLFDGYEAAGGAPVDREAVHWWEVFGTFRWGAMCAGAAESFRDHDRGPERAMIARRTSETEIDLLRLMAA
jgi:aminoglycoside phosphotransferase (APT) family kinase protein